MHVDQRDFCISVAVVFYNKCSPCATAMLLASMKEMNVTLKRCTQVHVKCRTISRNEWMDIDRLARRKDSNIIRFKPWMKIMSSCNMCEAGMDGND